MQDTPIDLTGDSKEELSLEEIEKRLPKYIGMGGFDPEEAEEGEVWYFAPSLTQSLTAENMLAYLSGEKTLAELYGLTAPDLYALAEVGCGQFRAGKYHDARKVFELLVSLNPRHAWFRNLLGTAFLRLDMQEQAAIQYQKAIEIDPKMVEPWVNVSELALQQEDWSAAFVSAQHALDIAVDGQSEEAVARAKVIVEALNRARSGEGSATH